MLVYDFAQAAMLVRDHETQDDCLSKTNVESRTLRPNCAVFYAADSRLINTASSYETIPVGIPRHISLHTVLLTKTRYRKTVQRLEINRRPPRQYSNRETHVRYRLRESALLS